MWGVVCGPAAGLTAGKVPEPLYLWRQYPSQSTRTHLRCSLEQLRACKVHYLLAAIGGVARGRAVQAWACQTAPATNTPCHVIDRVADPPFLS